MTWRWNGRETNNLTMKVLIAVTCLLVLPLTVPMHLIERVIGRPGYLHRSNYEPPVYACAASTVLMVALIAFLVG